MLGISSKSCFLGLDKSRMSNSWRNFDWRLHRNTGKRILNDDKGTEHALVILVVSVIKVRNRWAGAIPASAAHIRREEAAGTSIDAFSGGAVCIRNGVCWAHRHASPGRIVGESTKSAVVGASDSVVVCPSVLRASVDTEVCGIISKGKLGLISDYYVIEAILQAETGVAVAVGSDRTTVNASVGEIIAIKRGIRGTLGHAFHSARVSISVIKQGSVCVCYVGTRSASSGGIVSVEARVWLAIDCAVSGYWICKERLRARCYTKPSSVEREVSVVKACRHAYWDICGIEEIAVETWDFRALGHASMGGRVSKLRDGIVAKLDTDIDVSVCEGASWTIRKAKPSSVVCISSIGTNRHTGLCLFVSVCRIWANIQTHWRDSISKAILRFCASCNASARVGVSKAIIRASGHASTRIVLGKKHGCLNGARERTNIAPAKQIRH